MAGFDVGELLPMCLSDGARGELVTQRKLTSISPVHVLPDGLCRGGDRAWSMLHAGAVPHPCLPDGAGRGLINERKLTSISPTFGPLRRAFAQGRPSFRDGLRAFSLVIWPTWGMGEAGLPQKIGQHFPVPAPGRGRVPGLGPCDGQTGCCCLLMLVYGLPAAEANELLLV